MTAILAPTPTRTRAGLDDEIDRIEREDDADGPTGRDRQLGAHLLHLVREGDRRAAAAGRRAPRTLAEMRTRLTTTSPYAGDVCPLCEYFRCRCNGVAVTR
ncbi:hypothetical protein [Streptomyces ramulosus]|uniref:hypothetical protein n=1 Tax=Streptomyces TaxID=1883 RepID=UPI0031E8714B